MKRIYLLLIATGVLLSACSQDNQEQEEYVIEKPKTDVPLVSTYTVVRKVFNTKSSGNGKIIANVEQTVVAELGGVVKSSALRNNAFFRKDDVLIRLDSRDLELKIEKIKDRLFNNHMNFRSDLLSIEGLLKGSNPNIKDSVFRKLKSNSGLTSSEIDLKEAELLFSKSIIRAPFSGTVANVEVTKGKYILPGDKLFTIYNKDELLVVIKVIETDINQIKIGQDASVSAISSEKIFTAKVKEINPVVDENGLIIVKLKINQPSSLLLPGMNAIVDINITGKKGLLIPKSAIVVRSGRSVVFTLSNNLAKWNYVKLGRENGDEVEVIGGLKDGQRIIISNNSYLTDDTEVKVSN